MATKLQNRLKSLSRRVKKLIGALIGIIVLAGVETLASWLWDNSVLLIVYHQTSRFFTQMIELPFWLFLLIIVLSFSLPLAYSRIQAFFSRNSVREYRSDKFLGLQVTWHWNYDYAVNVDVQNIIARCPRCSAIVIVTPYLVEYHGCFRGCYRLKCSNYQCTFSQEYEIPEDMRVHENLNIAIAKQIDRSIASGEYNKVK